MKSNSIILFAVLLTSLIHFTSSQPARSLNYKFNIFIDRLKEEINASPTAILPFKLKVRVIGNMRLTSDEFKNLCIGYYYKGDEVLSPIGALNKTIDFIFYCYKESAKDDKKILEEIQSVDPIGLNVYLTKKNVENPTPTFMESVMRFQATMRDRVHLLKMRTDDSYLKVFEENHDRIMHNVHPYFRAQITTEYISLECDAVNLFTDMATEQMPPGMKMYRMNYNGSVRYQEHPDPTLDDVQILFGNPLQLPGIDGHGICIYYRALTQEVYVYDSAMFDRLDAGQQAAIDKLYPYSKGLVFRRPTALQGPYPTCGLFAIAYATMLLTGEDPANIQVKINEVHGDDTLYIRMHLLNMLVNRKLAKLK